ncbi:hypothetical protein N9Q76_01240 [Flavobacteriales bacterium]|nr:hypothetical protein [Flavobacteriales bacterium]
MIYFINDKATTWLPILGYFFRVSSIDNFGKANYFLQCDGL